MKTKIIFFLTEAIIYFVICNEMENNIVNKLDMIILSPPNWIHLYKQEGI